MRNILTKGDRILGTAIYFFLDSCKNSAERLVFGYAIGSLLGLAAIWFITGIASYFG
jgi:hypothetical protein